VKKIFLFMMSLIAITAFASEPVCTTQTGAEQSTAELEIKTDVPAYLKGATITVTLADGRSSTVPAEKFKVVPRLQQFITTHTESKTTVSCSGGNDIRRNRVTLLGGRGAQGGLNYSTSGTSASVESKAGLVGGAQYQYVLPILGDRLNIGVQLQTSKAALGAIGIDF
jgi:hypothetical protein